MQDQISALESLSAIDAELRDYRTELDGERGSLANKKQNLGEIDTRVATATRSIEDMDKLRGELNAEVRQMSLQIERSREKLSRCRTEREVNAAQREVEELRKLFRDRELEIEKLAGLADQARLELADLSAKRAELFKELGSSEGAVTTRLAELELKVQELSDRRRSVTGRIPGQLLRRYELVMKRKGTAVAHTTDGTCSACHMLLPPQMFQQLLRGTELQSCPHCNRIIYFRSPLPEDADSPAADTTAGGP